MPEPPGAARRRFEGLAPDASREEHSAALRAFIREAYLADPSNPYAMSGRSKGAERWEESRRPIVEAVDRDGDFLDVGCANGLLLETLVDWAARKGHRLRPHGIDFVPELVTYARARHPGHEKSFEAVDVFHWLPRRLYDFVRVGLDDRREADRGELLARLLELAVAPGGRLIVTWYTPSVEPTVDVGPIVENLGYRPAGRSGARGTSVVWIDEPRAR